VVGSACQGETEGSSLDGPVAGSAATDTATLQGTGSTFVEPLLREWLKRYRDVAPGVTVEYAPDGSAAGLERLAAGETAFALSEVPYTDVEVATLGGGDELVQVPWASAAIAVVYNLPDVGQLRLSPDTLASIYSGRIVRWDEPAVRAENPDVRLPNLGITVVFRADESGTTQILSSYFTEAARNSWDYGRGFRVRFPRGQGAEGSQGVTDAVKRTNGAIGYVALAHARLAGLPVALLGNKVRRFVPPSPDAVNAALAGATVRPFSSVAKLWFLPDSPGAYPLATYTYLAFRRSGLEPSEGDALRHFASWALTQGQQLAEPLGYVPLPQKLATSALTMLMSP
jgi:phosphate transport system substrate-binding protein